jgi:hypothetical protein
MDVGWLCPPKYTPKRPIPLDSLQQRIDVVHRKYRRFFSAKDPDLLGHVYLYDPALGRLNLIQVLRVGIYHDRLHYQDVTKMADNFKLYTTPVA